MRYPYCAPDTASSRIDVGLTQSKKDGELLEGGGKHAPARLVVRAGYPSTPLFVLRRLAGLGRDQRLNQREQFGIRSRAVVHTMSRSTTSYP